MAGRGGRAILLAHCLLAALAAGCGPEVIQEAGIGLGVHRTPDDEVAEGALYLGEGRLREAQAAFLRAVRAAPKHPGAWIGYGLASHRLGQGAEADKAATASASFAGNEPAFHLLRAERHLWRGDFAKAEASLTEALRHRIHARYRTGGLSVSEAHANLLLAEVRLANRKPLDAVDPLARARRLGSRPEPEGFSRADRKRLEEDAGRIALSIRLSLTDDLAPGERERRLRLLVQARPGDPRAALELGQAILARPPGAGFPRREAVESFDAASKQLPDPAEALLGLGDACLRGGDGRPWSRGADAEAARQAYLRLLRVAPTATAYLRLADIASRNRDGERFGAGFARADAKRWYETALQSDPGSAEARDALARLGGQGLPDPLYCPIPEIPRAADRWEEIRRLKPQDPGAARALAILAWRAGGGEALAGRLAEWERSDPKAKAERDALAGKARGFERALAETGIEPPPAGAAFARVTFPSGTTIEGRLTRDTDEEAALQTAPGMSATVKKRDLAGFARLSRDEWEEAARRRLQGILEAGGARPSLDVLLRALRFGRERGLRADLVPVFEKALALAPDVAAKCREWRAAEALKSAHWLRLTGSGTEARARFQAIASEFGGTAYGDEAKKEVAEPAVAVAPRPDPEPRPEPEPVRPPPAEIEKPPPKVPDPEPKTPPPPQRTPDPEPRIAPPPPAPSAAAAKPQEGDLPLEDAPPGEPIVQADFYYEKGLDHLRRAYPGGGSSAPDRDARAAMRYFDRAVPLYEQAKETQPAKANAIDEKLEQTARLRYGCFKMQKVHVF